MYGYETAAKRKFGIVVNTTKSSKELIFRCPKCNREKLYVNVNNGLFHCFRCDYKGKLRGRYSLKNMKQSYEQMRKNSEASRDKTLKLIYFDSLPLNEEQTKAIKDRGLTDLDIKYYNFCGRKQDNRIQIPNYVKGNLTDIVCAWEYDKTKINSKNPKYLNTSDIDKSKTLFNIYNIEKSVDKIILCEGIFNAITAGKNAVASFGCVLSDRQCELILEKEPKSILIAYDSDEPGVKGAIGAIKLLRDKQYSGIVEYVLLPKGVDINDIGHTNFIKYYNNNRYIIDLKNPVSVRLPKLLFDGK